MDLSNRVLSKAAISWTDVQKQLLTVIQTRGTTIHTSSQTTHQMAINKQYVKQCTDFLIKHIKNLTQAQVIEQLENFGTSCNLGVFKTPSEDDPTTVNAFLNTDDFFFEVSVNTNGEITEVKFSIFSEAAKSSPLLKNIFCSWDWDSLSKHIEGIKQNYILSHADHNIRANGFKAIECLEKDMSSLYQIQVKYLDKFLKNSSLLNAKTNGQSRSAQSSQTKYLEKLVNQTPIGVYKKSELGEPMRLYYYMSPLDLIQHHQQLNKNSEGFDVTYKILSSLTVDQLIMNDLGSYVSISLLSTAGDINNQTSAANYRLPDCSLLTLKNSDEDRSLTEAFSSYFNSSFSFEKTALFHKLNTTISNHPYKYNTASSNYPGIEIPGTYAVKLNKPIVMCQSTLNQLHTQIGIEKEHLQNSGLTNSQPTPFFELLAKNSINSKFLNDAYSVQLPDENQVYYITELDQPNCLGVLVDKIHFTHPQDLIVIIETLRAHSLNNNYTSATNLNYANGEDIPQQEKAIAVRILEIGLLAPQVVSVIMQHPKLLCYTTIEIDVSGGSVETRFRDHNDLHNPNVISEIIRRCHSIPVTIRALLMKYRQNSTSAPKRRLNNNNNNNNSDNNGFYVNNNQSGGHDQFNNSNNRNNNNSDLKNGSNKNSDEYGKTRKYNNNNNNNNNNKSSQSESSSCDSDENEDDIFDDNTPLFGNEQLSIYSSVPNRLTPSRRDSYRTTSSSSSSCGDGNNSTNRTPSFSSKSIFEFSNSITQQKRMDQRRHDSDSNNKEYKSIDAMSESSCDQEVVETFKKGNEKNIGLSKHSEKAKSDKSLDFQTPTIPVKKSKSIKSANGECGSPSPSPTMNTPVNASSNKKRKAKDSESGSSANSSLASTSQTAINSLNNTPTNTIHPPSAKRKMTQSSTPSADFKRHTSLIDNEKVVSSSGGSGTKKVKLKSSSSSVELTSVKSENIKKPSNDSSSGRSTPTQTKKESVLTAVINSNSSSSSNSNKSKISSSINKSSSSNSQNKKSSSSTSSPSSLHNSKTASSSGNLIKSKSGADDAKVRISKSENKSRSLSNKTNNLSATEMALKHPNSASSPLLGTSANASIANNTSTPALLSGEISKNLSSTRTPSPSLSASGLSSLATPSPILSDDQSEQSEGSSSNSTNSKYDQPSVTVKNKLKQRSSNSESSATTTGLSSLKNSGSSKLNTPPLTGPTATLASFALGLGSKFKSTSFKIPLKAKKDNSDEEAKINSPAATPTINTQQQSNNTSKPQINSPSKPTTDQAGNKLLKPNHTNRNIMPPPAPLSTGNKNNSSPKWQANYLGNMSPRYVNNYETIPASSSSSSSSHSPSSSSIQNKITKFDNNSNQMKQQQQIPKNIPGHRGSLNPNSTTGTNNPVPIPVQSSSQITSNQNSRQNLYTNSIKTNQPLPVPQNKSSIMPLMSFSSCNTPSSPSQETPSSPPMYLNDPSIDCLPQPKLIPIIPEIKTAVIPQQNQKLSSASPPSSQPPDSPTNEAIPIFVPKVIPLERNITTNENTQNKPTNNNQEINKTNNNNDNSKHILILNSVDIASPDGNIASPDDLLTINSPDQTKNNGAFASVCTTYIPTTASTHLFSTRNLGSTNEALSNNNSQIISPSSSIKVNSPTTCKIKSPNILEEDLMNEAVTG